MVSVGGAVRCLVWCALLVAAACDGVSEPEPPRVTAGPAIADADPSRLVLRDLTPNFQVTGEGYRTPETFQAGFVSQYRVSFAWIEGTAHSQVTRFDSKSAAQTAVRERSSIPAVASEWEPVDGGLPRLGDVRSAARIDVELPDSTLRGHVIEFSVGALHGSVLLARSDGEVASLEDAVVLARAQATKMGAAN